MIYETAKAIQEESLSPNDTSKQRSTNMAVEQISGYDQDIKSVEKMYKRVKLNH